MPEPFRPLAEDSRGRGEFRASSNAQLEHCGWQRTPIHAETRVCWNPARVHYPGAPARRLPRPAPPLPHPPKNPFQEIDARGAC
jgi:hypothetical protein